MRRPLGNLPILVLIAALVAAGTTAAQADPSAPVSGQVQTAFIPLRDGQGAANTALEDYEDELLSVRTISVGRKAAEPTIGVTSDGTAFFSAGDFDGLITGTGARTELLRSADGGLSWTSVQPTAPVVKTEPGISLDPYVWVDPRTDRVFNLDLAGCGYLQTSDDKGATWQRSLAACGDSVDHQSLFGGPPAAGARLPQVGYPNTLYYCSNRVLDSRCARSLDGGRTWVTTATPAYLGFDPAAGGMCNGLHGHGFTDNAGRVYLPKGHCGNPWLAVSEDGGDTWVQRRVSTKLSGTPVVPVLRYAGTFAHTSAAADAAGNVYYIWPDDKMRPWLSISRDQGRTWEQPLLVAPPGVNETNFPTVDAGAAGHVAITFVGSPASSPGALGGGSATRPWNQYVLISGNALDAQPLFLSTTVNNPADPIHRGDCFSRCAGMYDFLDVIVAPTGDVWATASDTCTSSACIAGTRTADSGVGRGLAVRQVGGPRLAPSVTKPGS